MFCFLVTSYEGGENYQREGKSAKFSDGEVLPASTHEFDTDTVHLEAADALEQKGRTHIGTTADDVVFGSTGWRSLGMILPS